MNFNKLCLTFVLIILLSTHLMADNWRFSANGGYCKPVGELTEWFNSGMEVQVGFGKERDDNWVVEGLVVYSMFSDENLSGYADGNLELKLETIAIWANGKYTMGNFGPAAFYLNIAGGPVYWKAIRGEIDANEELTIPYIPERQLEEWNMGFRSGLGTEMKFGQIGLDAMINYRLIIGSLWPTMQEHIELEGVNGFQSVNINIGLFYNF